MGSTLALIFASGFVGICIGVKIGLAAGIGQDK